MLSTFICKSRFNVSVEKLFAFHEDRHGFEILVGSSPGVEVIKKPNSLQPGETAILKIPILPGLRVQWVAKHSKYEKNKLFQDYQESGPFLQFYHSHIFESIDKNSSILEDRIEYEANFSWISQFIVPLFLKPQFQERHRLTAEFLKVESQFLEIGRIKN
ncbi:SRPBCC family protein [Leptospira sp. GIMC2001]|uniref:SRPBCC family protein n=1 Tax=Leptospira sp. GIMC2001 TaxID=1513297 RepID=UPI00234B2D5F|nr:hypothetical protein [Leptospira sp. GIMC2001]WCL48047.1 hypothetical protein O4O04_12040 [Leptospira sp. GIMC2001]